ncbi:MAG TPA: TM2 domain-containing protein [Dongiaceae bacterium]|jgi:TM2 domain-containing membrane protein YozV|nr:TM2 domain-containing protein [Dongiaceae bacterium]
MDQRTKDQITAELRAEYRETIKRTAAEDKLAQRTRYNTAPKSMGVAYMLWLFFGTLGGHRFYLGRISSAAVMAALSLTGTVITFALLAHNPPSFVGALFTIPAFIWWLIDAFQIPKMVP